MLAIEPHSFAVLEASARPAFAARLRAKLVDRYPHFLPRFPAPAQSRIIANMLSRATAWGLELQSGLTTFCELMIAIAANFDDDPEIRGVMERLGPGLDRSLPDIAGMVSDDGWARAESNASTLPFFTPHAMVADSLEARSAEALRLILADRPEAANPERALADAMPLVADLGLRGLPDALIVVGAVRSFYGAQLGWIRALQAERMPPRVLIEALRLRLALDTGRFV